MTPHLNSQTLRNFYQTSPMREGVLNWYPFSGGARVLESTGGVLTRLLREKCCEVVSFGGEYDGSDKFDYVVVIDPGEITVELLKTYHSYLNPHGRLLLAFENPYGLQYFAGKRSPINGLPYQFNLGKSKAEVSTLLKQAGFAGQKWYYPFTNHYFAREVYSECYLPNESLNNRGYVFLEDNPDKEFDERDLWKEIIRNNAFEFLCHSYLVEALANSEDESCNVDFAAITAYRAKDRAMITAINSNGTVTKYPIYDEGKPQLYAIERNHRDLAALDVPVLPVALENNCLTMPRLELPTMWDYMTAKPTDGELDETKLFRLYDKLYDSIKKSAKNGRCYWELVPANCFYDELNDKTIFFDQEYSWDNTDPDVAMVRAIYALIYSKEFQSDTRTAAWIAQLKIRYNLVKKWDELSKLADDGTWRAVFATEDTFFLDKVAEQAKNHILRNQKRRLSMGKIDKLREIELELLEQFMSICERENLRWYATHGTLLGALREGGFLIWDDDIDVAMPEDDYRQLMAHKEWFSPPYSLQTPFDKGYAGKARLCKDGTTAFDLPLHELLRCGGHRGVCIDIVPLNEIEDTGYYRTREKTIPVEYFEPTQKAKFEHLQINIPSRARKVLDMTYGYWQWPGGAEWPTPHNWFFDTETDYSVYMRRYTGWLKAARDKKIYLFGAGDSLKIWLNDFGMGNQVVATFDNNKNNWGKETYGVEIRNPAEIPSTLDKDSILVITSIWHREIGEQIEKMGVKDYYVFLDGLFEREFKGKGKN